MYSLEELEQAASVVLAPPSVVNSDQRHAAEQVFLDLKKSKCPYNFCRQILEQSSNDYVLFQAASAIKDAILREWCLLQKEDIESLRSFLLAFVTQKQGIQKYVKEQVLQVVAVIFKRGTLDTPQASRNSLLSEITHLMSNTEQELQLLGCSMIKAILNEYSFVNRSSNIGLSWEFHSRCKRSFEASELLQVFLLVIEMLKKLAECDAAWSRQNVVALVRFLSLAEQVLGWGFTIHTCFHRHPRTFDQSTVTLLRPDSSWRNVLLDPGVLNLFYKILVKVQGNEELAHHTFQCLIQLASLTGPIFPNDKSHTQYLAHFVSGFLEMSKSLEMSGQTAIGVSSIVNRLVSVFPHILFPQLDEHVLQSFVELLTELTCSFLQSVVREEEVQSEDTNFMEAVEQMMEAWASILEHSEQYPNSFFAKSSIKIFNCYLQCHLFTPDGLRGCQKDTNAETLDEICDTEGDDRELFADQLCSVGSFGRLVPGHAVPLLTRLLQDRVGKLEKLIFELQASAGSIPVDHYHGLDNLFEDIHWLILLSGHLLADESTGETPLIPKELIKYSVSCDEQTDIQATLSTLLSSQNKILGSSSICTESEKVDPIIKLISTILHLADVEIKALSLNMAHILSPQVGSSLVWFLHQWSRSYLLPDEREYDQLSVTFSAIFGLDTVGSKWVVGFLLSKIQSNLVTWAAEPQLAEDTVMLLLSLVDSKQKARVSMTFTTLQWLAQEHACNRAPLNTLPPEVQRHLVQALVCAGSATESVSVRDQYWNQFLQALKSRFTNLCHQPNFAKVSQKESVRSEVLSLLESFRGVAMASGTESARPLFEYMMPLLHDSVVLLNIYQNFSEIVVLVLEMFVDLIDAQITYLNDTETSKLYEVCLALMETYAKCNFGKHSIHALEEEEQFADLLLFMKMMTSILSKDFLESVYSDNDRNDKLSSADLTLYGLNIVIPLMSTEILKFPSLCSEYFKLATYVCDMYPEKMSLLPDDLFKNLIGTLEIGLANYDTDIAKISLEAVGSLAGHSFKQLQQNKDHRMQGVLRHFLKLLFDMLLLQSFDMDLLQPAASAFFLLICCNQVHYTELVQQLLSQQNDTLVAERLLDAFNHLTPSDMSLSLDRITRRQFRTNLETFLANVKGFLCVK